PVPDWARRNPAPPGERPVLTRRRRLASLAPELREAIEARAAAAAADPGTDGGDETEAGDGEPRSAEETRAMWDSIEGGWQRGRADVDESPWGSPSDGRTP
ncbi:hypothetical protein, partial [Actinomadura fibrosa]